MDSTIYAFTPPGTNPPFLNIRDTEDGRIVVSVRSGMSNETAASGAVPAHAEMELPLEELAKLAVAVIGRATGGKTPILMLPTETPPSVAKALNSTLAAFWPVAQEMLAMHVAAQHRGPREAGPLTPVIRPAAKRTEEVDVQPERMEEIIEEGEDEASLDRLAAIPAETLTTLTEQPDGDEPAADQEVR